MSMCLAPFAQLHVLVWAPGAAQTPPEPQKYVKYGLLGCFRWLRAIIWHFLGPTPKLRKEWRVGLFSMASCYYFTFFLVQAVMDVPAMRDLRWSPSPVRLLEASELQELYSKAVEGG